ncbi:hypothetical protein LguiB_006783 [Lonicera macranthoides]
MLEPPAGIPEGEVCFPFECYDPTENSWEALPDLISTVIGRSLTSTSGWRRTVRLGRAQELKELSKAFPTPCWSKQAAFVNYLGDKRYCLLLSEPFGRVTGFLEIHILLFRVEMLQQEEEEADTNEGEVAKDFCRVTLLRHKIYNATDITSEMLNPTNVFTMREGSNKQGVDCLGVFQMGKDRSNRASSADEGNGGGGEVKGLPQLSQTLQESERFLSQAGRPGGTLKVPIQTSADYVPQDEDAVQQSKEALGKDLKNEVSSSAEDVNEAKEPVVDESIESQTNKYSISANPTEIVKRIRTLQKKIQIIMRKSGFNKKHQAIVDALFREMKFLELQKKSSNCKASPSSSR